MLKIINPPPLMLLYVHQPNFHLQFTRMLPSIQVVLKQDLFSSVSSIIVLTITSANEIERYLTICSRPTLFIYQKMWF